ncbi:MAG: CpXC domain-containing protein [Anaerolineales bacterium]|nr:CpXC domain-containing protein [Anaerolineales bacterium]
MQTTINCPRCQTPFQTEIFQIIDAQRQPQLKQMLLNGQLNVASCPNCGTATQLAAPMLYHDAEHSLLMVYVPMELNLPLPDQERLIGQLTKVITDNTPPEQFRAYMLQPQTIITMKTFMEKVYATEGITPEMLQRQQDQMNLLQDLMVADKTTAVSLIQDNLNLIDETFFAILQNAIQSIQQMPGNDAQIIALSNLQARLFTTTEIGQKIEKRQMVLHRFRQEAEKQGGLSYELFIRYLINNADDEGTLDAIINMAQQGINYQLIAQIAQEIDKAKEAGDTAKAAQIETVRDKLVDIYEQMQTASQEMLAQAKETLDALLQAPNKPQAIQQNMGRIDEAFLYYLTAEIEYAAEKQDVNRQLALKEVQNLIMEEAERNMPPPLRLLNQLLRVDDEQAQKELVAQIPAENRPELADLLGSMVSEMENGNDPELQARVSQLQALLA